MLLARYIVLLRAKSNGEIDYELKSIALSHSLKMQPTVAKEVWPGNRRQLATLHLQSGSTEQWLLPPTHFYSDTHFIFIVIKGVSHYHLDLFQH